MSAREVKINEEEQWIRINTDRERTQYSEDHFE
jgi:hypothetical protein